jgi:hypothetical protein
MYFFIPILKFTSFADHAHSGSVRSVAAADKFMISSGDDENVKVRHAHGAAILVIGLMVNLRKVGSPKSQPVTFGLSFPLCEKTFIHFSPQRKFSKNSSKINWKPHATTSSGSYQLPYHQKKNHAIGHQTDSNYEPGLGDSGIRRV